MLSFSFCFAPNLFLAGFYVSTIGLLVGAGLTVVAVACFLYSAKFYFNHRQIDKNQPTLTRKFDEVKTDAHRNTYFYVGSVTALMMVFLVMNWTTFNRHFSFADNLGEPDMVDINIPNTITPVLPPPAAPKLVIFSNDLTTTTKEINETIKEPVKNPENINIGEGDADSKGLPTGEKDGKGENINTKLPVIEEKEVVNEKEIFKFAEKMPHLAVCDELAADNKAQYACANQTLLGYLGQNIRYPATAKELGIEGNVIISFVVEINGELTDITIVKALGGDCETEALRVVKKLAKEYKWIPGEQRGRKVRVKFNLPVKFKLKDN